MGKHTQKILTETETTGSTFPVPYTGNHGFIFEKRSSSGTLKLQFKSLNAENRWVDSGFKLTANGLKDHYLYAGISYRMHGLTEPGAHCDLVYFIAPIQIT